MGDALPQRDWLLAVERRGRPRPADGRRGPLPQFLNHLDRIGAEVVQESPESCVPIAPAKASTDLSALTTG